MKMYSLSCKDLGVPTCNYVATGETREEVMKMASDHAMKAHQKETSKSMEEMTKEEMDQKMMENIVEKNEDDV